MFETLHRAIPYLIVDIILLVLFVKDQQYKRHFGRSNDILIKLAYLILLLFIGLRGFVMTDFISYFPFYGMIDDIESLPEVILIKGWEPGFIIYSYLCKLIAPNYFAWNFLSAAIDLLIIYIIFKRYSCNHLFSLIVFFIVEGLTIEMNVLRQAKAIMIFLLAIRYIEKRELLKYSLMIVFASFFHLSSIFLWPLYFIIHKKIPVYGLSLIFLCGIVVLFGNISFISKLIGLFPIGLTDETRVTVFLDRFSDGESYKLSLGTIERIITYLIMSVIYTKRLERGDTDVIFYNMYICFFIVFFYCSESHYILQRLQYFFIPSFWIMYPSLFKYIRLKGQHLEVILCIFLAIKAIMIGSNPANRYENIMFGVESFEKRHSAIDFR